MANLSDEEKRVLKQASRLRDRMKAEALEAGEITLEDATGMASRKEQRAVNKAVKKAYREEVREEKEAERRKKERQKQRASGKGTGSEKRAEKERKSGTDRSSGTDQSSGKDRAGAERQRNRDAERSAGDRRSGKDQRQERGRKAGAGNGRGRGSEKRPSSAARHGRKSRHIVLKFFLGIILLLAVCVTGVFIYFTVLAGQMKYVPYETSYVRPDYVLSEEGVTNILLIGTDGRDGDSDTRSDAMMILSVNPKKNRLVMTSFLRDSYVFVNGVGQTRLNEAYFHGGPALLIQTIEENYQIGIDYYLHVNFFSFVDLIDAFGGVTIEVTQPELQYVNGYIAEYDRLIGAPERDGFLPEPDGFGIRNLTGRQALGYSRIRYIGTDFGRTDRQRTVMKALLEKVRHASPFTILKAVGTVVPQLETNIPQNTLVRLMMGAVRYAFYDVEQGRCPADGTWSNALMGGDQEVLAVDFSANREYLRNLIYE